MTDQPGKLLHRGDGVRTAGDGLRSLPSSEIADITGTGGLEIGICRRQQRDLREGIEASEPDRECKSQITEGTARIGARRSIYARFDCAVGARDFECCAMSSVRSGVVKGYSPARTWIWFLVKVVTKIF